MDPNTILIIPYNHYYMVGRPPNVSFLVNVQGRSPPRNVEELSPWHTSADPGIEADVVGCQTFGGQSTSNGDNTRTKIRTTSSS